MPYDSETLAQLKNIDQDKQIALLQQAIVDLQAYTFIIKQEVKGLQNRLTTLEARLNTPKIDTVVQAKATTSKFKFW